jgi:hypothetical protein
MVRKGIITGAILVGLITNTTAAASTPPQKLKVSPNQSFLVPEDGTPFFWMNDTAWYLPNLSEADIALYLSDRAQKQFTGVVIACKYHTDILYNGQGPFLNDNTDTPNETFWQHIDFIVTEAANEGLYVTFYPMWAEDYQSLGLGGDYAKAYRFGHWLGSRYINQNNIVWVVSGEYNDTTGWTTGLYDSVAQGLRDGDMGNHLITIHPGSGSSSEDFQDSSWLDFNTIQSGHRIDNHLYGRLENYEIVTNDYNLSPVKPTYDGESIYEHVTDPSGEVAQADTIRRKAYWATFAGAFGHTYGELSIQVLNTDPTYGPHWKDELNAPGATQLRFLKSLIESKPILDRIPDQTILASSAGTGKDHVQATRGADGSYAWIYVPTGGAVSVTLNKLVGPWVSAFWYNPEDGSYTTIGSYANSGIQAFAAPGDVAAGNDWVLDLESTNTPESKWVCSRPVGCGR